MKASGGPVDSFGPSDADLDWLLGNTGLAHSVVVYPNSTEDVVKVMKIATKYRMPIVPYAGGTSLEGHFLGVSISCIP